MDVNPSCVLSHDEQKNKTKTRFEFIFLSENVRKSINVPIMGTQRNKCFTKYMENQVQTRIFLYLFGYNDHHILYLSSRSISTFSHLFFRFCFIFSKCKYMLICTAICLILVALTRSLLKVF